MSLYLAISISPQYNSMLMSVQKTSTIGCGSAVPRPSGLSDGLSYRLRGGVKNIDCAMVSSHVSAQTSMSPLDARRATAGVAGTYDEGTLEYLTAEMSFSALYMHDVHLWKMVHPNCDNLEDAHARQLWQVSGVGADGSPPAAGPSRRMPNIQERSLEDEIAKTKRQLQETDCLLDSDL